MRKVIYIFTSCIALFLLTACENTVESSDSFEKSIVIANDDLQEVTDTKETIEIDESLEIVLGKEVKEDEIDVVQPEETSHMEVHYMNVGEADSALIICDDEAMLVDTGNPDQGTAIRLYLKQHNVEKLKYMLLTHSDRDHIGGAASVVSNVDIENLFMCRYEKDNDVYMNLINEINYKNMTWTTPEVGSEYSLGDAIITIVAPNREYDNPNDSSIAFVIRHGENSFIFTGDAEEAAESDIVNNGLDISADIYYVGHHGSYTSSTQDFLNKVSPKYAVISCAKDNEYGHPHIETMEKLKAMDVKLYRTDDQGDIICYSDGTNIEFNVEPSDNWNNGNSEINESASTQVKQAMAEAALVTEAVQEENVEDNVEITYVLNTNSKKFHKTTCDSVNDMSQKNRQDVTLTREEITELGYIPCKRCNP